MLCAIHRLKLYVYKNYPPPQMAVIPDMRPGHKGVMLTLVKAGYNRKARRLIERNLWRSRNDKKPESVLSGMEIEYCKTTSKTKPTGTSLKNIPVTKSVPASPKP